MVFSTPQLSHVAKPLSDHLFSLLRMRMASSLTLSQRGKGCRSRPGFSPTSSSPFSASWTPATVLSFPSPHRADCSPGASPCAASLACCPHPFMPTRLPAPPSPRRRREDAYLPAEWPASLSCLLSLHSPAHHIFYFLHFFFVSLHQNVNPSGAKIIICFLSGPYHSLLNGA